MCMNNFSTIYAKLLKKKIYYYFCLWSVNCVFIFLTDTNIQEIRISVYTKKKHAHIRMLD